MEFGSTIGIEFIDSDIPYGYSVYFKRIIDFLKGLGYKDKIDLYGAPYDFRLGPHENYFMFYLKGLIEKAYIENQN
jgi:lysophospholipase III